ncbi:MAG: Uma2 family endonuclease [Calditrichaeota bacterium]|nr:Uma2 family endonuclease [Calditrichota bacterium]
MQERFTYDDYKNLPNDGKRYEIIEGELLMAPSPKTSHQKLVGNLFIQLAHFIKEHSLGQIFTAPLDVILSAINIVQPDILFISRDRESIITEDNIQGAPDLIIEVVSPFSAKLDRTIKKKLYYAYSVKEYWIADPEEETIDVFVWTIDGYELRGTFSKSDHLRSSLLKTLDLNLEAVF